MPLWAGESTAALEFFVTIVLVWHMSSGLLDSLLDHSRRTCQSSVDACPSDAGRDVVHSVGNPPTEASDNQSSQE